jgi:hypothetical protein
MIDESAPFVPAEQAARVTGYAIPPNGGGYSTLPGLRIPLGSSVRLSVRISS